MCIHVHRCVHVCVCVCVCMCMYVCVCVYVYICVCVCPVGVRGWLVISFKSLSLLPAGGAFGRIKTGTVSCLQVK